MYDTVFVLFCASAFLAPGKVKVRVTSQAGDYLGETWFECLDRMPDMFERLKGDPDLQRLFFTLLTQHNGLLLGLSNVTSPVFCFNVLF